LLNNTKNLSEKIYLLFIKPYKIIYFIRFSPCRILAFLIGTVRRSIPEKHGRYHAFQGNINKTTSHTLYLPQHPKEAHS